MKIKYILFVFLLNINYLFTGQSNSVERKDDVEVKEQHEVEYKVWIHKRWGEPIGIYSFYLYPTESVSTLFALIDAKFPYEKKIIFYDNCNLRNFSLYDANQFKLKRYIGSFSGDLIAVGGLEYPKSDDIKMNELVLLEHGELSHINVWYRS